MAKSYKAPFAGWLVCAGATALLTLIVFSSERVQRLDARLLGGIMTPTGEAAGGFVNAVAHLGDPPFLALAGALACAIALGRRRPWRAGAALAVIAGANLTTQLLKTLLSHPRIQPALLHGEMPPNSFPSGHATAVASLAIAFVLVVPRAWRPLTALLGCCFVVLVDVAVLILAWHYPTDVLGGTLVAAGWGCLALAALRRAEAPSRRLAQPANRPASATK